MPGYFNLLFNMPRERGFKREYSQFVHCLEPLAGTIEEMGNADYIYIYFKLVPQPFQLLVLPCIFVCPWLIHLLNVVRRSRRLPTGISLPDCSQREHPAQIEKKLKANKTKHSYQATICWLSGLFINRTWLATS